MPPFHPRAPLPRLALPVPIDPTGLNGPTRGRAQGPTWRRVGSNAYVPVDPDAPPEQRIADALARVPTGGAITGWAALRVHGAAYFDGLAGRVEMPVPIATGSGCGRHRQRGIRWTYERLEPEDVRLVHGLPVTAPARACFDAMRQERDWRRAVVAADMALAAKLLTLDQVRSYVDARSGWRHADRATSSMAWVREGFRSPREAQLFLLWRYDAGLPEPLINRPIFDLAGNFLACPDIFEVLPGLLLEYDGEEHRAVARHAHDVDREEACRAVGLEYTKVVGPDMADPAKVVRRMHSARSRALWLPPERRRWTTEWPAGWHPWW